MSRTFAQVLTSALLLGVLSAATMAPTAAATRPFAPPAPSPLPAINDISGGGDTSCAVTLMGSVLCWGNNHSAQLGDGSMSSTSLPIDVVGLPGPVRAISVGTFHTCALTNAGAVWCWGRGTGGAPDAGWTPYSLVPAQVPGLGSGIAAIASGRLHTCAVTTGGGVKCWGVNTKGQLGNGASSKYPTPTFVPVDVVGLSSGITSIVAGDAYSCAVTTGGGVTCWGDNAFGQIGDGTTTIRRTPVDVGGLADRVTSLTAGGLHVCAIMAGGLATCWGRNNFGQLGDGTTIDRLSPVPSSVPIGATRITAGVLHTCALSASGGVSCWGTNAYGRLGLNPPFGSIEPQSSSVPLAVSGLSSGVREISAGDGHTCALLIAGPVRCWGYNGYGQLGDGTSISTQRVPPVTVDFTVHPKIVNLTAVGVTVAGPFTAPTMVTPAGTSVTWQAQTVPARPGEPITVWLATKTGLAWSAFTRYSTQTLDADGSTYFTFESPVQQWVSVRFTIDTHGADPSLTSLARPVHFR